MAHSLHCVLAGPVRKPVRSTIHSEETDMQLNSLDELFVSELKDLYSAEKQLL